MTKDHGICRICGEFKYLTYEHIPPRGAGNDRRITYESFQNVILEQKPSTSQNGMKQHSLCAGCNNSTGSWYGPAFIEWTREGKELLDKLKVPDMFYLPFHLKPLNVVKQTIVMALALLEDDRIEYYDELRRFILNKSQKYLPDELRVYVYLTRSPTPRFANVEGVIFQRDTGAIEYVNAEIALPPFGYCITSTHRKGQKTLAEHKGLCDISWFSEFDYNAWTTIYLNLPLKAVSTPFPLDYRTEEEVIKG